MTYRIFYGIIGYLVINGGKMLEDIIEALQIELENSTDDEYTKGVKKAISIIRSGDKKLQMYVEKRVQELEQDFNKYQEKYMKEKHQGPLSLQFFGEVVSAINCKKELQNLIKKMAE